MSGPCTAELEHSYEMMNAYANSFMPSSATPAISEKKHQHAAAAISPRAPKVETFFSGVAAMAERAAVWIKQAAENVSHAISRFQYWKASEEYMLSLTLAVKSSDPHFIMAQVRHLIACRERQCAFLKSQPAPVAKAMDKRFHDKLDAFVGVHFEKLTDHKIMMSRRSVSPTVRDQKIRTGFTRAGAAFGLVLGNYNKHRLA